MASRQQVHKWQYRADRSDRTLIYPDGCRDILFVGRVGEPGRLLLTEFDFRPRKVMLTAGTEITGFRLLPGAVPHRDLLVEMVRDADKAETVLRSSQFGRDEIADAIEALVRRGTTVEAAARSLGTSVRTMQRLFARKALPPPEFWRLLARARRTVGLLSAAPSLADVACEAGYSDGAHMNRELLRWFGATPARLRQNRGLLDSLRQPGLGNWTGEHIPMR
jgi:AraC-like DNA-binding protein